MFRTYEAKSDIPEIDGKLHSSLTAVVDEPAELDEVSALCADSILAKDAFGADDDRVRETLHDIADRLRDVTSWSARNRSDGGAYRERLEIALAHADALAAGPDRLAHLMLSLAAAAEVWRNDERVGGRLRALVSIRPHWLGKSGIYYRAEAPAIVLSDGSWRCSLTRFARRSGKFVLNAGAFAIALVRASAGAASTGAESLVEALRARTEGAARVPLKRLDRLEPADLQGRKGVIVLLHGLFSTDARTFDGFIERWRDDAEFKDLLAGAVWRSKCRLGSGSLIGDAGDPGAEDFRRAFNQAIERDFLITGWPHNTLTSIVDNADQLIRLLKAKLGASEAKILFVCHSRGGLLARRVAAEAFGDRSCSSLWPRFVGCVTFGTPHEGAPLAEREQPARKLAALLMIGSATMSVLSIAEVLAYYRQEKVIEGVDDLAPSSVQRGGFLRALRKAERATTDDPVKERYLPVLPVGGDFAGAPPRRQTRLRRMFRHISGLVLRGANDLVVELRSSRPAIGFDDVVEGGLVACCEHSGYFEADQIAQPHFGTVIDKARDMLGFEAAVCARVTPISVSISRERLEEILAKCKPIRLERRDDPSQQ